MEREKTHYKCVLALYENNSYSNQRESLCSKAVPSSWVTRGQGEREVRRGQGEREVNNTTVSSRVSAPHPLPQPHSIKGTLYSPAHLFKVFCQKAGVGMQASPRVQLSRTEGGREKSTRRRYQSRKERERRESGWQAESDQVSANAPSMRSLSCDASSV